ncbi:cardiolipin synthase [Saccharomyces paradoxus]|uniref:Cardiolipin synthase n=1 Tax=Saccharomyces paradoxus TaxID=27291 RepID=A0A8B8UMY8_SACPA|nr:Crd1 [Saccharomyces paradoxus]QHS72097.1 Crd1 [Saccharomyces paradoxus]
MLPIHSCYALFRRTIPKRPSYYVLSGLTARLKVKPQLKCNFFRVLTRRELATVPSGPPNIKNKLLNIPNILTLSRIGCTPFIGLFIITNNLTPALSLFAFSSITDFMDGYIARKYGLKTVAGTILDPLADKLLMITTTLALSVPSGPQIIPVSIAGIILGRDVLLAIGALFIRYSTLKLKYPGRVSWSSYWDIVRYPSAEVKPSQLSKWNTFFQMIYLGSGVLLLLYGKEEGNGEVDENFEDRKKFFQNIFSYLGYVTATTTIISGASYALKRNAFKLLK